MAEEIMQEDIIPVETESISQGPKTKSYGSKVYDNLVAHYGKSALPDESAFVSKLTNPEYASKVYDNLIAAYGKEAMPDITTFNSYLIGGEKKNPGASISSDSGSTSAPSGLQLPGFSKEQIDLLKTNTAPNTAQNQGPSKVIVPTNLSEIRQAKIQKQNVENFGKNVLELENTGNQAIQNTIKIRKENPNVITDPTAVSGSDWTEDKEKARLFQGLQNGTYQVGQSRDGKPIIQRVVNEGIWNNFKETLDKDYNRSLENDILPDLSEQDQIKWLKGDQAVKDEYLPKVQKGIEPWIGETAASILGPAVKAGAGGVFAATIQKLVPGFATAAQATKFGNVMSFVNDMAHQGYGDNLKRTFESLKQQGYSDEEAIKKARLAAIGGEVSGGAGGFMLGGAFSKLAPEFQSAVQNIETQPFIKSLKHIASESVTQGAAAGASSIGKDVSAKLAGAKITPDEILANAKDNAETMAALSGGLGLGGNVIARMIASKNTQAIAQALGIVTGIIKVPKPIKAQAEGVISQMPPTVVKDMFTAAEENGVIEPGTAEKTLTDLEKFNQAGNKIPPNLPTDIAASLQGILTKIDDLEFKKGLLDKTFHKHIDEQINAWRSKADNILKSGDVFKNETDDLGNPIEHPEKDIEQKDINLGEMLDKQGIYNGEKGLFYQDGQTVIFKPEGQEKEIELGNVDELNNVPISQLGIKNLESVISFDENGNVTVRGKSFVNKFSNPLKAINKDKDGNIVSVNLETIDGQKRTFRGQIAEDIAYQMNLAKNAEKNAPIEEVNVSETITPIEKGARPIEKVETTEDVTPINVKVGDQIQWTSQGVDQFKEPKKITSISNDGKFVFVEGTNTGIPIEELNIPKEETIKTPSLKAKLTIEETEVVPETEKTKEQVAISKKALGEDYNFSKDFDVRGGDVVAADVLSEIKKRAEKNKISVAKQREIEVDLMSKTDASPTEFNIVTAASHLLEINKEIKSAQDLGQLKDIEILEKERDKTLNVIRALSNKAGRNLGLFNLIFKEVDNSEIKVYTNYLQKILKVPEVPETVAELDKSNLTKIQKDAARPYVAKLEQVINDFNAKEKELNNQIEKGNIIDLNNQLDKARKQGFEEGLKSATKEVKQKKSTQLKDLASKLRASNEFDKFLKGTSPLANAQKMGVDLGTYKEVVANVLEAAAKAVELGENVSEAIKKAVDKLKDIDKAKLLSDVQSMMSRAVLPDSKEVRNKISEIVKYDETGNPIKAIAKEGLIKDLVHSYLKEDMTNDQVIKEALFDLKSIIPDITREDVVDAYAEKGQFAKQPKVKIEDEIKQKKEDIKRLAVKENRLRALEAADDYLLEETTEAKKKAKSLFEKDIDDKIKDLQKQKSDKTKIDEINKEIEDLKKSKSVYNQAIKSPKKASEALIAARLERDKIYSQLGIKLEKNAKNPILIERQYQDALKALEESDKSKEEKSQLREEYKNRRNLELTGTKQHVVSALSDDISNHLNKNKGESELNSKLKDILNGLSPTGEKLDLQINKAYEKLNKLSEDKDLTKEEKSTVDKLKEDLLNNNQLASDELASKRLKKQWENEIKNAEADIASGNFTKIPVSTYDFRANEPLVKLNKERQNKTGQLRRIVADAQEKTKTWGEKIVDLSTKFLVSKVHTAAKVAEASVAKPLLDAFVDLTAGKITTKFSGAPYKGWYSIKKAFDTFGKLKNKAAAEKYIENMQTNKELALENLKLAYENGGDTKKALQDFQRADLDYAVSTLYHSIEANSLTSFIEYVKHGATDYDVNIGKSSKKFMSDYKDELGKAAYVAEGWIRMHSAMKSSFSARSEMMRTFAATMEQFQKQGKDLNPENISLAMVVASEAYESGRLTNKTSLSKYVSRLKGSEKSESSVYTRIGTKLVVPVSTIAINLVKYGIDFSSAGAEGWSRLYKETKKGMKLNEIEGRTFDKFKDAVIAGRDRIPLQERLYVDGVMARGLFGLGLGLITMVGLKTGDVKYGGTYEDQKKRKIMGSNKQPLKPGEWEFFGERIPHAATLFLNHLPQFLMVSLVADNYQINKMGGDLGDKFETTMDEVQARLPFQTLLGLTQSGKRRKTVADRANLGIVAEAGEFLDKKSEIRDKTDFLNRLRANVGLSILNPTKRQQEEIHKLDLLLKGLPEKANTPENRKKIEDAVEKIKNTDYKELEFKQKMEKLIEEASKPKKE